MFEDLKSVIEEEYDKIEDDDSLEEDIFASINSKVENQNKKVQEAQKNEKVDEEQRSSELLSNYLMSHNKSSINDLTTEEIQELLANIDEEIRNME